VFVQIQKGESDPVPVLELTRKHGHNEAMSIDVSKNLDDVRAAIAAAVKTANRATGSATLVAVSKTHNAETISLALDAGQRIFGENRVQEAAQKWPGLRARYSGIELHLIGPLQSNKAAEAVALFDAIQTVDREKIAVALAAEMKKQGRTPKLYVQVNTGLEPQKAGIAPAALLAFLRTLHEKYGLTISGLMCIPPVEQDPALHFRMLAALAKDAGLKELSMGMSGDYAEAIAEGATLVRVGSAIFGERPKPVT
jgi:PLP dependent protein